MNRIAKNLSPLAALSLIAGSSLLNASACCEDMYMRNLENRISALECQNVCCSVINPPARPFAQDCWGFYVAIDPLLWQAHENGLPIGVKTDAPPFFNSSGESKIKQVSFHWAWGFRLMGGFNFAYDGWDTALSWTFWRPDGSKHFSAGQNEAVYPSEGHPALLGGTTTNPTGTTATHAGSHWKLALSLLDLELGREFFVSKYLVLRPFAGLRNAWIKQKFRNNYTGLGNNPLAPDTGHSLKQKTDFWGLGILGGVDTEWFLGCGWGIFANFSGSLLHGFIKADYDEYTGHPDRTKAILTRNDDFYHIGRAISDAQLGVRYDWVSCDECFHFGAELGWEQHMFWGQNQFIHFVDNRMPGKLIVNQGDLTTQGFFARVRVDF